MVVSLHSASAYIGMHPWHPHCTVVPPLITQFLLLSSKFEEYGIAESPFYLINGLDKMLLMLLLWGWGWGHIRSILIHARKCMKMSCLAHLIVAVITLHHIFHFLQGYLTGRLISVVLAASSEPRKYDSEYALVATSKIIEFDIVVYETKSDAWPIKSYWN